MAEGLTLYGFAPSVYTRIARLALAEMELQAHYVEVNPFDDEPDPVLAQHSPFNRVPVLRHGDFALTETAAILRYLDQISPAESLVPANPKAAARMAQVMGIVDAYGYWPWVRQVFSDGWFSPRLGLPFDPKVVETGLAASSAPLGLLEDICAEGLVLGDGLLTLADLHLAPMIDYFAMVPEGAALLGRYSALSAWWAGVANRPAMVATAPDLSTVVLP